MSNVDSLRGGIKNREKAKEGLLRRTRESFDRRDDSGRFKDYLRTDVDIPKWTCGNGDHIIDMIPFLCGTQMPKDMKLNEGEEAYNCEVWIHQNVGLTENSYICLTSCFNLPCPICEHRAQMKEEGADKEELKDKWPKRRTLYNIICYDTEKEEQKGVQVWEVAHFFMEKKIAPLSKSSRTGKEINFADPDTGKSIAFERKGSKDSTEFLGHRFEERGYTISDEILESAFKLDMLLHIPTYEEISEAYWGSKGGGFSAEATTDDAPSSEGSSRVGGRARPRPQPEEGGKKEECPGGGRFGYDTDQLGKACETCEVWEDCAKRADEIADEARQKRKEKAAEKAGGGGSRLNRTRTREEEPTPEENEDIPF